MWSDEAHGDGMTLHRALRATSPVLSVAVLLLTACGGPAGSGTTSVTADPVPSPASPILAVADLDEFVPTGPDEVIPFLLTTSRAAADDLLARARIVDLVAGASETLAVLDVAVADDLAEPVPAGVPELSGFRRTLADPSAPR
eukprot:gene21423-41472_t